MGIDKGNTNYDVMVFDSLYGVQYPGVSGQEGGGNAVHFAWNIQATPSIVVITPDKLIATHQVWPPTTANVVDSVLVDGGILQSCMTSLHPPTVLENLLTVGSNPARNTITLFIHPERSREFEIVVRNSAGQTVSGTGTEIYEAGRNALNLDLSRQPGGIYILQLFENGQAITTKKIMLLP